jgi:hypothetical protein
MNIQDFSVDGNSLFCLTPESKIRQFIVNLVKHIYFEEFCLLMIIINSLILILDDATIKDPYCKNGLKLMSEACSVYFILELALRISAMGFYFTAVKTPKHEVTNKPLPRRFMQDPFNVVDFFLCSTLFVTLFLDVGGGSEYDVYRKGLTTLKAFKALRPIRIAKSPFLRDTAESLVSAVSPLCDAAMINFFFIYIFSILGL